MKMLESIRKKLGMWNYAAAPKGDRSTVDEPWHSRRISAPARWLCGVTDIGRRRRTNQDKYHLSGNGRLWIVADGMGGHAAGEVASALTIEAIVASLAAQDAEPGDAAHAGARLARAFAAAQDLVSSRGHGDADCLGMGSTAMAAIVDGEALHLCHVGDVRAYHWSRGELRHVTNDHSLVWEMVLSGVLTPAEARTHPHRGTVTQAIGASKSIVPEISRLMLRHKDRVLLCSDGLWEALADHDLRRIVGSRGSMRDLALTLVDRANAAGGEDNITAVLYEHTVPRTFWSPFRGNLRGVLRK